MLPQHIVAHAATVAQAQVVAKKPKTQQYESVMVWGCFERYRWSFVVESNRILLQELIEQFESVLVQVQTENFVPQHHRTLAGYGGPRNWMRSTWKHVWYSDDAIFIYEIIKNTSFSLKSSTCTYLPYFNILQSNNLCRFSDRSGGMTKTTLSHVIRTPSVNFIVFCKSQTMCVPCWYIYNPAVR